MHDMMEAMSFTLSKESCSIRVPLWQFYKISYCIQHLNPSFLMSIHEVLHSLGKIPNSIKTRGLKYVKSNNFHVLWEDCSDFGLFFLILYVYIWSSSQKYFLGILMFNCFSFKGVLSGTEINELWALQYSWWFSSFCVYKNSQFYIFYVDCYCFLL